MDTHSFFGFRVLKKIHEVWFLWKPRNNLEFIPYFASFMVNEIIL